MSKWNLWVIIGFSLLASFVIGIPIWSIIIGFKYGIPFLATGFAFQATVLLVFYMIFYTVPEPRKVEMKQK